MAYRTRTYRARTSSENIDRQSSPIFDTISINKLSKHLIHDCDVLDIIRIFFSPSVSVKHTYRDITPGDRGENALDTIYTIFFFTIHYTFRYDVSKDRHFDIIENFDIRYPAPTDATLYTYHTWYIIYASLADETLSPRQEQALSRHRGQNGE